LYTTTKNRAIVWGFFVIVTLLISTVASLGVAIGAVWEIAEWVYEQVSPVMTSLVRGIQ